MFLPYIYKISNEKISKKNIINQIYFQDYSRTKSEFIDKLDCKVISQICTFIEKTIRNKKYFCLR